MMYMFLSGSFCLYWRLQSNQIYPSLQLIKLPPFWCQQQWPALKKILEVPFTHTDVAKVVWIWQWKVCQLISRIRAFWSCQCILDGSRPEWVALMPLLTVKPVAAPWLKHLINYQKKTMGHSLDITTPPSLGDSWILVVQISSLKDIIPQPKSQWKRKTQKIGGIFLIAHFPLFYICLPQFICNSHSMWL